MVRKKKPPVADEALVELLASAKRGVVRASKSLARRSYTLQENSSPSNEGTYAAQRLRLAACKSEGS